MARISTQRVTDLCIAINAIEGTEVAPEYVQQNERVRKTLYECMMKEASLLHIQGATLNQLSKALHNAGWDENKMIQ